VNRCDFFAFQGEVEPHRGELFRLDDAQALALASWLNTHTHASPHTGRWYTNAGRVCARHASTGMGHPALEVFVSRLAPLDLPSLTCPLEAQADPSATEQALADSAHQARVGVKLARAGLVAILEDEQGPRVMGLWVHQLRGGAAQLCAEAQAYHERLGDVRALLTGAAREAEEWSAEPEILLGCRQGPVGAHLCTEHLGAWRDARAEVRRHLALVAQGKASRMDERGRHLHHVETVTLDRLADALARPHQHRPHWAGERLWSHWPCALAQGSEAVRWSPYLSVVVGANGRQVVMYWRAGRLTQWRPLAWAAIKGELGADHPHQVRALVERTEQLAAMLDAAMFEVGECAQAESMVTSAQWRAAELPSCPGAPEWWPGDALQGQTLADLWTDRDGLSARWSLAFLATAGVARHMAQALQGELGLCENACALGSAWDELTGLGVKPEQLESARALLESRARDWGYWPQADRILDLTAREQAWALFRERANITQTI